MEKLTETFESISKTFESWIPTGSSHPLHEDIVAVERPSIKDQAIIAKIQTNTAAVTLMGLVVSGGVAWTATTSTLTGSS